MRKFVAAVAAGAALLSTGGTAVATPGTGQQVTGQRVTQQRAETTTCRSADLDVRFGRVSGTAGTTYREVVLTNRGPVACVLRGFPGVSYVDAAGNQVGAAAVRVGERGPLLTLPHGAAATSDVGFAAVDNFDPADCRKTPVRGIRVHPPDETAPRHLPLVDAYGCAGDVGGFGAHLTVASVRS
ncbi:DUF4232 domain-containing protein [Saccharothrix lopnurensis]|uniref:DUF4232 domain-containing protein n=1 Tax=Saccharothrix lopnurensis TaxID=1670621 RepID=A0ABW1PDU7_9PSEU